VATAIVRDQRLHQEFPDEARRRGIDPSIEQAGGLPLLAGDQVGAFRRLRQRPELDGPPRRLGRRKQFQPLQRELEGLQVTIESWTAPDR
jgi:hypothetical protein